MKPPRPSDDWAGLVALICIVVLVTLTLIAVAHS